MGTRSLTIIQDNGKDLATIYRHWDGYPEAHGQDLKNWFADCEIVNGYTSGQDRSKVINGIGCLAALVCAKLFENGHDPRVLFPETREVGEEYIYILSCYGNEQNFGCSVGPIRLQVYDGPMTAFGMGGENCTNLIYDGLLKDFDPEQLETPDSATG